MKKHTFIIGLMTFILLMTSMTRTTTFATTNEVENDPIQISQDLASEKEINSNDSSQLAISSINITAIKTDKFRATVNNQVNFEMEIDDLIPGQDYVARIEFRVPYGDELLYDYVELMGYGYSLTGSMVITEGSFSGDYLIDNITLYEVENSYEYDAERNEIGKIYSEEFYDKSTHPTMLFPEQFLYIYGTSGNVTPEIFIRTDKPEYTAGDNISFTLETEHPSHHYFDAVVYLKHTDYANNVTESTFFAMEFINLGSFAHNSTVYPRTSMGKYEISYIELISENSGRIVVVNKKFKDHYDGFYNYVVDFDFSYNIYGTIAETTPPVFNGVKIITPTVDKNGLVTIEVQAEDKGSGVKSGFVHIHSYTNGHNDNQYLPLTNLDETTMVATSKLDPFTTLTGEYSVIGVRLFDGSGNWVQEYYGDHPEKFSNLNFNVTGIESLGQISGSNRYNTAVEISKEIDVDKTVIVALGENYPDALSAGPLAFKLKAPIILSASNRISSNAIARIKEISPEKIIVLGGSSAISEEVINVLEGLGAKEVVRISGQNRYATATKVAELVVQDASALSAVLANGDSFADALSIGGYAASKNIPILLTRSNTLSKDTKTYLINKKVKYITLIGGYGAISLDIENELKGLGISVKRIQGANRYETSVNIASNFYTNPEYAIVSSGLSFADALAAAPLAAQLNIPILLTRDNRLMDTTSNYIFTEAKSNLRLVTVIGGNASVNQNVKEALIQLLEDK